MNTAPPLMVRWDGETFAPASQYWAREADRHFVVGETYKLVEHHDRSANSHRHFFATVNDAWDTLPDELREEYPSPEHLRKKALIRTGFHTCRDHVCNSKAEALRLRAFVTPMDDYAIVVANECVVRVYTAMSQKQKAMGKVDFQRSKDAVLGFIDKLLGVDAGETAKSEAA